MTDVLQEKVRAVQALLRRIAAEHAPAALASSLGAEDMVLTDLIFRDALRIEVFTLDTGRLHNETYALLDAIAARYGARLRVVFPRADAVEDYVSNYGINGFYSGVELRRACCHIRKVEPLRRALAGKRAWITGLRRGQSAARQEVEVKSYDSDNGLIKFNPLVNWSHEEVWTYIRTHAVPYNELHDRGFPSIGCAPCTRAVAAGEDIRSGRWWWEQGTTQECGLHATKKREAAVA
ncbi:MAG: phosphoadenylyl-sulfate reductase [Burkholderiales bacterium]